MIRPRLSSEPRSAKHLPQMDLGVHMCNLWHIIYPNPIPITAERTRKGTTTTKPSFRRSTKERAQEKICSMPYPVASSSSSSSILAKCGTTITCVLRSIPLWIVVIIVLLVGFARRRISDFFLSSSSSSSPPISKKTNRKIG